ncbi:aromatic ring-hydroxylating dioxygenase subunit alpha [Sphingobium sp.]|uniref:aromatic ring-hydroxylating dioxygenase subunit alpha n=1 Tax=Sphingobium sp. TaxID=1912891 RepID=UPI0028BD3D21|nr:aromatic ring-hydroxylating dioxygenase subunit alpha [Sphingobium sp.]
MYSPENAWYIACWSQDLPPTGVIGRTILDQPLVFYRTEQGELGALHDRCPHRFAPLSRGKTVGDNLQCPYHGLEFNSAGACARNPYGRPLRAVNVRSYPLQERHRAVWVWMGVAEDADPSLIPDFSYLADAPDTAFSAGELHIAAGFEILIDNIMDLTHTQYLHANSIAGNGMVHKVKPVTRETGEGVEVRWSVTDVALSPFHAKLHAPLERADQLSQVSWSPPTAMRLKNVIIPAGKGEEDGYIDLNAHFMTPETRTSTHYFFAASRNYHVDDRALNDFIADMRRKVFATEDEPMIALVQARMGDSDFWDLKPLLLGVDEAAVRVRRRLKTMQDEDQKEDRPVSETV